MVRACRSGLLVIVDALSLSACEQAPLEGIGSTHRVVEPGSRQVVLYQVMPRTGTA
jgi:hypothetical protein